MTTASCHISNCNTFFREEQDAIKVNNLIAAHWLNILCKRSCVSNGIIAISAMLTSCMQLPTCTFVYRNLSTQKTSQRIVSTSIQLTFQSGVLCNRSCIVRSSETLIIWSVRSVKLLRSDKSGHSKCNDRATVKILTMVKAQNGHAECCLNWIRYYRYCEFLMICMQKWMSSLKLLVILAQCRYTKTAQRMFKYIDIQYTSLTLDKILNSLI